MTPQEFVINYAGELLKVIMAGAVSLLGFTLFKEITR